MNVEATMASRDDPATKQSKSNPNLAPVARQTALLVILIGIAVSGAPTLLASHSSTILASFTSSVSVPDFSLGPIPANTVPANGTFARSVIVVNPRNDFDGTVSLSDRVPHELTCSQLTPSTVRISGYSSLSCSSATPGSYNVTIIGNSGSLTHNTTTLFTFTPISAVVTPNFLLLTNSSSLNFDAGASGTLAVTVSPLNGFTGTVTLLLTAPAEIPCTLSTTSIQTSGAADLTCASSISGDYVVTITAIGGTNTHSKPVEVHVTPALHAPAIPSTSSNPAAIIFGIAGGIIVGIVVGTILILKRSRRGTRCNAMEE